MMLLPPLPPLLLPLPPLPAPKMKPVRDSSTVSSEDYVQVTLKEPDDEFARVELVSGGVEFHGRSMVPKKGTLHMMRNTAGAYVYRWRV